MDDTVILRAFDVLGDEGRALLLDMDARQRRIWLCLGRLYLERATAASADVAARIARIERAILAGDPVDVPATQ